MRRQVPVTACRHGVAHDRCDRLAVIAVAFNNPLVVAEQGRLVDRHLVDDADWYVVDNSADPTARAAIEAATVASGGTYLAVPGNPYVRLGSPSHGFALDVAWRSLVCGSNRRRVAVLDHDVFPVRPTSLVASLGSCALAGIVETRGDRWYVWPGLMVIDVDQVDARRLSFMPGRGVDTGGLVPRALRGRPGRDRVAAMHAEHVRLRETDGSHQSDFYDRIGD